jgi:lysozyme
MPDIIEQLILHEGSVDHAYSDSLGFLTIGVGRLIDKRKGGRLRPDEIRYLLHNDIKDVRASLDKRLPWWRGLSPVRQKVLEDMCFNLGIDGLCGFKNTLAAIQGGDYERAAVGMLASKWASQVGGRAIRLAQMMRTGADYA